MNLLEKARRYAKGAEILSDWLGSGGITESPSTAQSRADCCLKCPKNVKGNFVAEAVAKAIREQVRFKNHMQLRVAGEKELGTCDVCQCVNRLKIWVPLESIRKYTSAEELSQFPDNCWLVKELK